MVEEGAREASNDRHVSPKPWTSYIRSQGRFWVQNQEDPADRAGQEKLP